MAEGSNDQTTAVVQMMDAQARMLRELLRHLVEENYIEPAKAAKIALDAASESFPPEESTGESYDLGREALVSLATALIGWPGSDRGRPPRSPTKDLG